MLIDLPRFKCYIQKSFLTNSRESGLIEGYCFAVTLLESRPLFFTVHTIEGAVYSRLPIQALAHTPNVTADLKPEDLDPWGALASSGNVVQHAYLKDYSVRRVSTSIEGHYWATVDYDIGGFAQDPEQHKTSNIIMLRNGQIAAWPNNWCLFTDEHFTDKIVKTKYSRQTKYWRV